MLPRMDLRTTTNCSLSTSNAGTGSTNLILCPDCPASECIAQWLPAPLMSRTLRDATGDPLPLSLSISSDLDQHLLHTWHISTLTTYGSSLQANHLYRHHLSDQRRAPSSADLIATFVSHLIGTVASSTVSNYVVGLRAWHLQNRFPWLINDQEYRLLLHSAATLAPTASLRPLHAPYTVAMLQAILQQMNLSSLLHAAAAACLVKNLLYLCMVG